MAKQVGETKAEGTGQDEFDDLDMFGTPEASWTTNPTKRLVSAKAKSELGGDSTGSGGPQGAASAAGGGSSSVPVTVELPFSTEGADAEPVLTKQQQERLSAMDDGANGFDDGMNEGLDGKEIPVVGSVPATPRTTRYGAGSPLRGSPTKEEEVDLEVNSLKSEVGALRATMERMFEERRQSEEFMRLMMDERRRAEDRDERRRHDEERQRDLDREVEYERVRVMSEAVDAAKKKEPTTERVETTRTTKNDVMKLLPPSEPKPAVRAGNWLARLDITIGEQSDTASEWFREIKAAAEEAYGRYQKAVPLDRLDIEPVLEENGKWGRLRARVTDMLLEALPTAISEELVATRRLHPTSILFRVLVLYAPGGTAERAQLLSALVEIEEVVNPQQGLGVLRDWNSDMDRAEKLNVVRPDPSLLLQAVDNATEQWIEIDKSRSFRIQSARVTLELATNPTYVSVLKYVKVVEAELLSSKTTDVVKNPKNKPPKVKAAKSEEKPKTEAKPEDKEKESTGKGGKDSKNGGKDGSGKGKGKDQAKEGQTQKNDQPKDTKGGGKGSTDTKDAKGDKKETYCKFFSLPEGCSRGGQCGFWHDRLDPTSGRCFRCGSESHRSLECTRPKREAGTTSSYSGSGTGKGSGKVSLKSLDTASEVGTSAGVSTVGLTEEQLQAMIKRAVDEREKSGTASETGSQAEDFSSMVKGLVFAGKQKTIKVSAIITTKAQRGLLDSGATNIVRNWRPTDSLETRRDIRVELAVGDHRNLEISDVGSIVMGEGTVIQPIIPLLMMTRVLNCELSTGPTGRLRLTHPTRGVIKIDETDGTPQIDSDLTTELIDEIESKVRAERTKQVRESLVRKAMSFACGWATGKMPGPEVHKLKGTEEAVEEFTEFLRELQVNKFDEKIDEWGSGDQRGCPQRKHVVMSMKLAKFGLTATEADVMRLGKHIGADDDLDHLSTEAVCGDKATEGVCVFIEGCADEDSWLAKVAEEDGWKVYRIDKTMDVCQKKPKILSKMR